MDFTLLEIAKTLKRNGLKLFLIEFELSHTLLLLTLMEISLERLSHRKERFAILLNRYFSARAYPKLNLSQPLRYTLTPLSLDALINSVMMLRLQLLLGGSII